MARKLTTEEKVDRILLGCADKYARSKVAARIVSHAIAEFMADRIATQVDDDDVETTEEAWREAESALAEIPNVRPGGFRDRVSLGYGGPYARASETVCALQDRIDAQGPLVPTRAAPTDLNAAIRRAFGIDDNEGGG